MEEHYVKTGIEKFFAWHMHSDARRHSWLACAS